MSSPSRPGPLGGPGRSGEPLAGTDLAERAAASGSAAPSSARPSPRSAATRRRPTDHRTLDTVVITGAHRSGTTFLASVIAQAQRTVMFDIEPLNVTWGLRSARQWYPVVTADSDSRDLDPLAGDLVRLRRARPVRWTKAHPPPLSGVKSAVRSAQRSWALATAGPLGRTVVIKDPFLTLSLSFAVHQLTDRPVVVAMKHPAAWCMSLRRVDWHPGTLLEEIAARPELADLADEVGLPRRDWSDVPILEASAWAWRTLTAGVLRQMDAIPAQSVILVPLESIRADPVGSCMELVHRVGLRTAPSSEAGIRRLTQGSEVVPSTATQHVLERDTRSSLDAWRTRLDASEREKIWRIAGPTASTWYEQ